MIRANHSDGSCHKNMIEHVPRGVGPAAVTNPVMFSLGTEGFPAFEAWAYAMGMQFHLILAWQLHPPGPTDDGAFRSVQLLGNDPDRDLHQPQTGQFSLLLFRPGGGIEVIFFHGSPHVDVALTKEKGRKICGPKNHATSDTDSPEEGQW